MSTCTFLINPTTPSASPRPGTRLARPDLGPHLQRGFLNSGGAVILVYFGTSIKMSKTFYPWSTSHFCRIIITKKLTKSFHSRYSKWWQRNMLGKKNWRHQLTWPQVIGSWTGSSSFILASMMCWGGFQIGVALRRRFRELGQQTSADSG